MGFTVTAALAASLVVDHIRTVPYAGSRHQCMTCGGSAAYDRRDCIDREVLTLSDRKVGRPAA